MSTRKSKSAMTTERTQLLRDDSSSTTYTGQNDSGSQEANQTVLLPIDTTYSDELRYIIKNSLPVLVTFVFQYLIQTMIPIYFASKLGSKHLSAASLSITTLYVSGPVIFNGFSTSLDTLCSTAYGAGHYKKVGLYCQRCITILLIVSIPLSIFWANSRILLKHFADDEELLELCVSYLQIVPIGAPAIVIFECGKRFLQSQNKFSAPTRVIVFAVPLTLLLNTIFLDKLDIFGPVAAFVITYWCMALSLGVYIFKIDGYQCWDFDTELVDLFTGWSQFFQLGIPGVLMILSEALAFQILTLLSTKFGETQLAAQSVVSTLASLAFQIPFSIGICSSTRIANIIGARSENYKITIRVVLGLACFLSFFNFAWMLLFRYPLARLFSDDSDLVDTICYLFTVVGFNQFLDCINIICAAVLRGQGRQKIGSGLSLISYYIIATPCEFYMGFHMGLEVFGLWLGLAVGVTFLSVAELICVLYSDWEGIIEKSKLMI
ncbi:hypothetical protein B5S28_g217 [[Candida] boidinii]|nr:hypothetical protein B5S28_g217 [[Candida] boidinii]OWB59946.1 hypothetical protein B5S29_g811 [[Candida] boidinii]OWB70530.1 hypothetical protein B5S31_g208 [[Candida] boidinii]